MNSQPMKAANAKQLRVRVLETYPNLKDHMDTLWPKNAKVALNKLKGEGHTHFI